MVLTKSDKDELNKAILEYLYANGYKNAYDALVTDAEISNPEDSSSQRNILETKWKSVARLKRQVIALEDQIKRYREENDANAILGGQKEGLPKQPERFKWIGHKHKVTKIAFHPVVDCLASGSEDASIKLWDWESGENDRTLKGHTSKINWIAFNNQGTFLASWSKDLSIKLWNIENFQWVKTLKGHEHNISSVKFMPSGDQIVSSSWDKTIKVWDWSTGFCLKSFEGHDNWVMSMDINADGTRMVSSSKSQEIIYWDLNIKSDKNILTIFEEEHENIIDVVVFAPIKTAKTITKARMQQEQETDEQTGGTNPDEETKQDDAENTGEKEPTPATSALAKRAEELKKARERIAQLKMKKTDKTKIEEEEKKDAQNDDDVVVTWDFVASGSRDKRIKVWNAKRGSWIMNLIGHDGWVNDIVFHPNGKYLISASDDKSLRIWDLEKNGVWIK